MSGTIIRTRSIAHLMQLIVKLKPEQASKARELLQAGLYASYNEFVMVAIDNQLNLEDQPGESTTNSRSRGGWNPPLGLPGPAPIDGPVVQPTGDLSPASGPIWGQYNRFAPAIVALRTASQMADASGTAWVPIDDYWEQASEVALAVGHKLRDLDVKRGNKRGSRLDTAFPMGQSREKSLRRFQQQFAGDLTTRKGRPIGMAPECGFLRVERHDDKVEVAITEPGRQLATLPFPAIDEHDPTANLAPAQVSFLLAHVATHIPNEARFARQILGRIDQGDATLQDLDRLARDFDPTWNDDVASTQRGGLVGRLNELGLLTVGRAGLNSTYTVTEAGRDAMRLLKGGVPDA